MLHRGEDAARGAARAECLNWFLRYSSTISFHQFPKHFGGNSFRICTYVNRLIHTKNASCFYRQPSRWVLRWGVLTAETEVDLESRGRQDGFKMHPAPSLRMPLRSSSPASPGCWGFAYECKSFLVAEVEPGNSSPCSGCRAAHFHPRNSLTRVTLPGSLSAMCSWDFIFSFSAAAVAARSHPRWGDPRQWTC